MQIHESIELQKQFLNIAKDYVVPLFWGERTDSGSSRVENNSTAFILDTGSRKFLVTAAHVYESYINKKRDGLITSCQLANIEFELEGRVISYIGANNLDIATFEITDAEITQINKTVLKGNSSTWPPARPIDNQSIFVAGFPGLLRENMNDTSYIFKIYSFHTPVTSISNRHFGCAFERQNWLDVMGNGLPPENFDMGGISGSPVLAIDKSSSGIISWHFVGVIYEANASSILGEIFFAHHADFIRSNGEIVEIA